MFQIWSGSLIIFINAYIGMQGSVIELFPNALGYILMIAGIKKCIDGTLSYEKIRKSMMTLQVIETARFIMETSGKFGKGFAITLIAEGFSLVAGMILTYLVLNEILYMETNGQTPYINAKFITTSFKIVAFSCIIRYLYLFNPNYRTPCLIINTLAAVLYSFSFMNAFIKNEQAKKDV